MGSINLSQSIQEKQALARGKFFDKGFFINATVLLLIVSAYATSEWYLSRLEAELLSLQTSSADKTATLNGPTVNRSVDVRNRIVTIVANQKRNMNPQLVFSDLERIVVPAITLTGYTQSNAFGTVDIAGMTINLRYLAQQMFAFKRLEGVQSVHAESIKYNEKTSNIEFILNLTLVSSGSEPTL